MCMCVCVCMCMRVRACVSARAGSDAVAAHATTMMGRPGLRSGGLRSRGSRSSRRGRPSQADTDDGPAADGNKGDDEEEEEEDDDDDDDDIPLVAGNSRADSHATVRQRRNRRRTCLRQFVDGQA
jgi:hypothetical protein